MVNIRAKGQRGERDIVNWCNEIYAEVHEVLGIPLPPKPIAQRRQNQQPACRYRWLAAGLRNGLQG